MARKKAPVRTPKPPPPSPPRERPGVTAERFGRLYKLVQFLGEGAKGRNTITSHLGLDVRGFYRDLEVLRAFDIEVNLDKSLYILNTSAEEALKRLPYPDPHLTLGDMQQLAKGRTAAHRKLTAQITQLLS